MIAVHAPIWVAEASLMHKAHCSSEACAATGAGMAAQTSKAAAAAEART